MSDKIGPMHDKTVKTAIIQTPSFNGMAKQHLSSGSPGRKRPSGPIGHRFVSLSSVISFFLLLTNNKFFKISFQLYFYLYYIYNGIS